MIVEVLGGIAVERGASFTLSLPRKGAVRGCLVEDDHIASRKGDVIDNFPVCFPQQDVFGTAVVRLVAARYDAQTAIAGVHIRHVKLTVDQTAAHSAVLVGVEARSVESDVAIAMKAQPFSTGCGSQYIWLMIQLPTSPQQGIKVRDEFGMS